MNVYEAAMKRRSVRRFQDKPVPYDVLERCVDAGRLAPSAMNRQLCEYIIVDDKNMLPTMAGSITRWGGQPITRENSLGANSPKAYIIILINNRLETEAGNSRRVTLYDVGMAAENIMLVALEEGLGTCPVLAFKKSILKKALNIPADYDTALLLALGYPDESPRVEVSTGSVERWIDSQGVRHIPKRRLRDITHRNRF